MTIDVKVPQLPESVTDATLVSWHKTPGQAVARDENLVDLETDKVVLEVPAPVSGVIKEIRIQNGATVTSGELLATLEPADVVSAAAPADTPTASKPPEPTAVAAVAPGAQNNAAKLSPAVRRLLDEHDVEPSHIQGTGKGGRILKTDVQDYVEQRIKPEADAVAEALPAAPVSPAGVTGQRREHRVPMTRL
jgi:2-oxoglutarate dehydrogenase E2 component (dihydrolipoamide succinyltransferase)